MRQLDLKRALLRRRTLAEDVENQPGAVDHLAVPRTLQIALLHRRNRGIHNGYRHAGVGDRASLRCHLPFAQQGCRTASALWQDCSMHNDQPDRGGQPNRLGEPMLSRPARIRQMCSLAAIVSETVPRQHHRRPRWGNEGSVQA